jgi:hypothetical protein
MVLYDMIQTYVDLLWGVACAMIAISLPFPRLAYALARHRLVYATYLSAEVFEHPPSYLRVVK